MPSGATLKQLLQRLGNNQFEKHLQQKLEKYFINIESLPRFTKSRVTITLYKKSTKVFLILQHFNFINVQIDGSSKYQPLREKCLNMVFFLVRVFLYSFIYLYSSTSLSTLRDSTLK